MDKSEMNKPQEQQKHAEPAIEEAIVQKQKLGELVWVGPKVPPWVWTLGRFERPPMLNKLERRSKKSSVVDK